MKKLILTAVFLMTASVAMAADFSAFTSAGQKLYYNISGNSVVVTHPKNASGYNAWTGFDKPTGSLTIPESVTHNGTTYTVSAIGESAFYGCTGLTSVSLPNTLTSIEKHAFCECVGITTINIPDQVSSIGDSAFQYCHSITTITISNLITRIGNSTFSGCNSLSSITLPYSVTTIGAEAFRNCTSLSSLTIPPSVTSIGTRAFCNTGLSTIDIPTSVTQLGVGAFSSCDSLLSATIPNSITGIEEQTFFSCGSLTTVIVGSSVTSIGARAFGLCGSLSEIHMRGANSPTIQENTFVLLPSTAIFYVPCNAATAYQEASTVWSQYNFTEEFSYYLIAASQYATRGTVEVIHAPECDDPQAEILATPNEGYHFVRWSDGDMNAHRYLTIVQDTTLLAEFESNAGINDIASEVLNVYASQGCIHVTVDGQAAAEFSVYDLAGRRVAHVEDGDRSPVLPNGAYLVKVGTHAARKVVVVR